MNSVKSFTAVLDKTGQQIAEDINEFVEQFAAAKRSNNNSPTVVADNNQRSSDSIEDARQAAAECLAVLAKVKDDVRSTFDAANRQEYSDGRIIEQAEEALRRIVQTHSLGHADSQNRETLDTAEASGLIIRCRKYWKANTDHPLELGTLGSLKPYGEFLEFVSEQFELEPSILFDRELEVQQRERALKERIKSQQPSSSKVIND